MGEGDDGCEGGRRCWALPYQKKRKPWEENSPIWCERLMNRTEPTIACRFYVFVFIFKNAVTI